MTAETPAQADAPFDCPPTLYARWVRADFRDATDGKVDRLWRATSNGDRAFWIELVAAQQPQPAPELAKLVAHPDDLAEEWLAEAYEPGDYDRDSMLAGFRAGHDKARALYGAPAQPAPELAADNSVNSPGPRSEGVTEPDRERRALKALDELFKVDSDPCNPWNQRAMKIIARGLLDSPAPQPAPELAKLRALLGEVGVMAANAPDDREREALEDIARAIQGATDTSAPLDRDWLVSRAVYGLGQLPADAPAVLSPHCHTAGAACRDCQLEEALEENTRLAADNERLRGLAASREPLTVKPADDVQPAPDPADAMRETASRELAAAMAEARGYREALQQVAARAAGNATKRMIGDTARRALEGQ